MPAFSGVEPLVGELVGLRTFRVDESGLLPLFLNETWYDGTNTAVCSPPTGDRRRTLHTVTAPRGAAGGSQSPGRPLPVGADVRRR